MFPLVCLGPYPWSKLMTCTSCSSLTTFFLTLLHTYFDHGVYHLVIPLHLHVWLTDSPAGLFRGWRVAGGGWGVAADGWRVTGDGWRVKKPLKATVSSPPTPRKLFPFGPPLPLEFLSSVGRGVRGGVWIYSGTIQFRKSVISPHKRLFDAYYF